jgi:Mce-associated membrane protein
VTDVRRPERPTSGGSPRAGSAVSPSAGPAPRRRRVAGERSRPTPPLPTPAAREVDAVPPQPVKPAEPAEPAEPARPVKRVTTPERLGRRSVPGWVLAALAVLLVVVLVVLGLLLRAHRQAQAVAEARGEAVRAARTAATAILSYDYRHLDADFAAGRALATSPFAEQYARTTADAVKQVATDTKASVVAEVAAVGVEQASQHQVVVVMFVNQTTTSTRLQRPQVDQNRVEMTLVERDGRWLVSQVRGL